MKQYTTPEQTAKLTELGFGNPKSSVECELPKGDWRIGAVGIRKAYSIGELIEMLPQEINSEALPNRFRVYPDHYKKWKVDYSNIWGELYSTYRTELIDALYDMCVKLKDEGVV